MAAPTPPTGLYWVEETTSGYAPANPLGNGSGFIDSAGNHCWIGRISTTAPRLYYSTDDGETWSYTAFPAFPSTPDTTTIQYNFASKYYPADDYLFCVFEDSGNEVWFWALSWNPSTKALATLDSAEGPIMGGSQDNGPFFLAGGKDSTSGDYYLGFLSDGDSPGIAMTSVIFDTGTETFGTPARDIATEEFEDADGTQFSVDWAWAHALGDDPEILTDPTGDTFYAFGTSSAGGANMRIVSYAWDAVDGRFERQSSQTFAHGSLSVWAKGIAYNPDEDRWYIVLVTSSYDVEIWKSNTNNPISATFSLVYDSSTDDTKTVDSARQYTARAVFSPAAEKWYVAFSESDTEVWVLVYDVVADTASYSDTNISTIWYSNTEPTWVGVSSIFDGTNGDTVRFLYQIQTDLSSNLWVGSWVEATNTYGLARYGWGRLPIGG